MFATYDPGNAVADEFVFQLLDRGITVVERSQLKNIMKEQDLWKSGRLDTATVKRIGKLLGVDALIPEVLTLNSHIKWQAVNYRQITNPDYRFSIYSFF